MTELIALLPPEVSGALVAFLALVTALRGLLVLAKSWAEKTATLRDDEYVDQFAGLLEFLERALDWVSVGPTRRKR